MIIDWAAVFARMDAAIVDALRNPRPPDRRRRGRIMLADGTVATGSCVSRVMPGHPRGAYVTLILDDAYGRRRTIDDGGRQWYGPERDVEWLP